MFYHQTSKYKSWSKLKKQMNDLLCSALQDKITYDYTSYHEVHNRYGRASIRYESKELVSFSWNKDYEQVSVLLTPTPRGCDPIAFHEALEAKMAREKWMPECILSQADFSRAITTFLNTDIAAALTSDNYLLRVFAYLDSRVGKRTLAKIREDVESLPEWVRQFYRIRCEAEGIPCPGWRSLE